MRCILEIQPKLNYFAVKLNGSEVAGARHYTDAEATSWVIEKQEKFPRLANLPNLPAMGGING